MPPDNSTAPNPTPNPKWKLPNVWKLSSLFLVIIVAVSIWLWRPWQASVKAADRTITVTGTATIKAEPDEYVFSPTYQIAGTDKTASLKKLTDHATTITAKLKALGVPDSGIKNNSSNYSDLYQPAGPDSNAYSLSFTISLNDKKLAQKVQDYLLTTNPTGSLTPTVTFSSAKQKTLENQARDQAEKDARTKADQSAKNLGFKVNTIKSVQDGSLSPGVCKYNLCPALDGGAAIQQDTSRNSSLGLQPGENELSYSVQVIYYIH